MLFSFLASYINSSLVDEVMSLDGLIRKLSSLTPFSDLDVNNESRPYRNITVMQRAQSPQQTCRIHNNQDEVFEIVRGVKENSHISKITFFSHGKQWRFRTGGLLVRKWAGLWFSSSSALAALSSWFWVDDMKHSYKGNIPAFTNLAPSLDWSVCDNSYRKFVHINYDIL